MKKTTLFLLLLLACQLFAQKSADMNGVTVGNVKVPFYNKGTLQAMIFADKAEYRAQLLYGYEVVINMLQKKVNPDWIQNDWKLVPYPLNAPLKEIARFWKSRLKYCDAVLTSPEGSLHQLERTASGNKKIQLRSPMLDLNGVGFSANFKRHEIKVDSDVNFVMRTAQSDPRTFGNKVPAEYEFIRGRSDMLHLDNLNHRIILVGNVSINDGKMQLTCDRLTVVMSGKESAAEKGKESSAENGSSMQFSGVKKMFADGHVKVVKLLPPGAPKTDSQEMTGDHLTYDTTTEVMTVTGDRTRPQIKTGQGFILRGKELVFFRSKMQMIVPANCWLQLNQNGVKRYLLSDYGNFNFETGICDFLGNVRGSAPQHELACRKMRAILQRNETKKPKAAPAQKNSSPLSGAGTFNTGSMELKRVLCKGNVKMFRREAKSASTLSSDEAELNYIIDKAIFTGNVKSTSDGNTLETPLMVLNLQKSATDPNNRELVSAEAKEKVKITGPADAKGEFSLLTADRGFFDYKADRIDFIGNVAGSRGDSKLNGDRLELYLAPLAKGSAPVAVPGVAAGATGSSRTLKRAVITGKGVMEDGSNKMLGDKIEYFFAPALQGAPKQPGIFQSGSLRVTKVLCDGNVKLLSAQKAKNQKASPGVMLGRDTQFRELTSEHMISDLLKHTTVFSDNVAMSDGSNKMNCNKLELFAKPQPAAAAAGAPQQPSDPDADPFELPAEKGVPNSIVVGNGLELDSALATGNVVIDRREKPNGSGEKVFCERAFFNSKGMTIECTGDEKSRPRAEGAGKKHYAEKFTIFLKDERLESTGETITK